MKLQDKEPAFPLISTTVLDKTSLTGPAALQVGPFVRPLVQRTGRLPLLGVIREGTQRRWGIS